MITTINNQHMESLILVTMIQVIVMIQNHPMVHNNHRMVHNNHRMVHNNHHMPNPTKTFIMTDIANTQQTIRNMSVEQVHLKAFL